METRISIHKTLSHPINFKSLSLWFFKPTDCDADTLEITLSSSDTEFFEGFVGDSITYEKDISQAYQGNAWNLISLDNPTYETETNTEGTVDLTNIKQIVISITHATDVGYFEGAKISNVRINQGGDALYAANDFQGKKFLNGGNEYEVLTSSAGLQDIKLTFPSTSDLSKLNVSDVFYIYDETYPGEYLFHPGASSTQYKAKAHLNEAITATDSGSVINVVNGINLPNEEGYVIFNYGFDNQELVKYLGKSGINDIILDPDHTFAFDHAVNSPVNLATNVGFEPNDDGRDHAVYTTGTNEPVVIVQNLLEELKANGVKIRFIIVD